MPDSIRRQTYDRIWELLEAHAPFANLVKAGNRIKQTGDGAQREAIHRAPADYPQAAMTAGRLLNSTVFTETETFSMERDEYITDVAAGADDWIIRRTYEYQLSIESGWLRLTDIDPVEEAAQVALLLGGPKLGLAAVERFGPITSDQVEAELDDRKSLRRLKTTLKIPIIFIQSGRVLIAA